MPIETLTFLPWGFWLILLGIPHKIWCHWNQVTLMSKINVLEKTCAQWHTICFPGLKTHNGDGHRKEKVAKKQWVEFKGYIQASSQMYTFISFQGIASEQLWACLTSTIISTPEIWDCKYISPVSITWTLHTPNCQNCTTRIPLNEMAFKARIQNQIPLHFVKENNVSYTDFKTTNINKPQIVKKSKTLQNTFNHTFPCLLVHITLSQLATWVYL